MAGNPLINQGTLNRLRGSVVFASNATLNITAPYLSKEAISIAFDGDAGLLIPTLTGGVTSPEPYQMATVTIHLLKSQSLSNVYKKQIEANVNVGDVSVITDSAALGDYALSNCIIKGVRDITFDGVVPGFVVTIAGIYNINSNLWDLIS
jgi:hypothetical protein